MFYRSISGINCPFWSMTLVSEIFAKSFGVELITSFVSAKRSRRGRKKFLKKKKKKKKKIET